MFASRGSLLDLGRCSFRSVEVCLGSLHLATPDQECDIAQDQSFLFGKIRVIAGAYSGPS